MVGSHPFVISLLWSPFLGTLAQLQYLTSFNNSYGAERFEDGASQINKSDMFFGDDGELTPEQLKQLDEVTLKNVRYVKMTEGDVVLLDNYKCMHGRNVFDGTRKHGVAWFGGWSGEEEMKVNKDLLKTVSMA